MTSTTRCSGVNDYNTLGYHTRNGKTDYHDVCSFQNDHDQQDVFDKSTHGKDQKTCQIRNAITRDVDSLMPSQPRNKIADVTYGKGVFWKKIDLTKYEFHPSDLKTCPDDPYDFRNLPYQDSTFDVVVLDPPYVHTPGKMIFERQYQNRETTGGMSHAAIIDLYREGMSEAFRILMPGGFLWIKCQDEIESGKQKWSHVEIHDAAVALGFYAKDLFILTPDRKPIVQQKRQKHARKNHSYLWIFQKPKEKRKGSEGSGK